MPSLDRDQFWIIDGHGLIYRSIFRPGPPLTSPSGEPTRGTYAFCQSLFGLVDEANPAYLAIALDTPRKSTFRRKLYPDYKANRDGKQPDDSIPIQVRRIEQIIRALGIPAIKVDGFEADDVIAALVETCSSDEVESVVVTRDKDLHQLVGPACKVFDAQTNDWFGRDQVQKRWGVPPEKIPEIMALTGDKIDNVPGVPGIGEKTALELIKKYGSVDGVVEHADELTPAKRKAILEADLDLCWKLVKLRTDVPLEGWSSSDLEFDGFDMETARPLFENLGFRTFL